MNTTVTVALAVGALVVLVAAVALRLADRIGLPSLLLYLALGVTLGESGLGRVEFEDVALTQTLGVAALVVILAEGGLTTRWSDVRRAVGPGVALSTVGVVVSVAVVAAVGVWLLDFSWAFALLVGAVVTSTDAAAVFSSLRRLPLPRRMVASLELESGLNDAPAILLVLALSEQLTSGETHPWYLVLAEVVAELVGGSVIGLAIGFGGAWLLRRLALPLVGFYPLATLALCVLAFATADLAHTSGFVAVYLCGLVLGNAALPHRAGTIGFAEGLASLAQIGLFVLLGLLVSPDRLVDALGPALLIGGALLLLARPLSVLVSLAWFKVPFSQQVFIAWAGLRGAVPIVLATFVLSSDVPHRETIFNAVFFVVVVSTIVQGTTLEWVAGRLGLLEPAPIAHEAPLEVGHQSKLDLVDFMVAGDHAIAGSAVRELGLPRSALIAVVTRGSDTIPPRGSTVLEPGDHLFVLVPRDLRADLEDVFSRWRRRV
jgi:potassium/hydrogen antiporter